MSTTQEEAAENNYNDNLELYNFEETEEEIENDLTGFDNINTPPGEDKKEKTEDLNLETENDDKLKFEEEKETEDEEDFDLQEMNKKFNTDYKTKEDFKKALTGKANEEAEDDDEKQLTEIQETLSVYEPLMKLSSEDLMRKQYESIALQNKKDLNDEDVQIEIEDQLQKIIDNGTLELFAKDLRNDLKSKVIEPALQKKNSIETEKKQRQEAAKKTEKENLQNAFADFHSSGNFYGIKTDENKILNVYKKASSDEFLKEISSNPKLKAELALFVEFKEDIFKKATGLNYGDGMKAVLDEYKSKKETVDASRVQSKGGSAGTNKSEGLIADILYEAPIKNDAERRIKA